LPESGAISPEQSGIGHDRRGSLSICFLAIPTFSEFVISSFGLQSFGPQPQSVEPKSVNSGTLIAPIIIAPNRLK